jgi:hypothetical protein
MRTKTVKVSKFAFFQGIRRPVFLMHNHKVERPVKGGGYRRREKHQKSLYENE